MIRAALSRARWHGRVPLSCFSPDFHPEKQDKSVHSSSFPRAPIISTKEILREHPQQPYSTAARNGFVEEVKMEELGIELQYSLLFPDIFVSVGGDKQDFSNLI